MLISVTTFEPSLFFPSGDGKVCAVIRIWDDQYSFKDTHLGILALIGKRKRVDSGSPDSRALPGNSTRIFFFSYTVTSSATPVISPMFSVNLNILISHEPSKWTSFYVWTTCFQRPDIDQTAKTLILKQTLCFLQSFKVQSHSRNMVVSLAINLIYIDKL